MVAAERSRHPSSDELACFMRGELQRPAVLAIVRHLLTGCPQCIAVTRRVWSFAARAPRDPETLAERAGLSRPGPGHRKASGT